MTTEEKLKHFEETAIDRANYESSALLADYKASLAQLEEEHRLAKIRQAELLIKTETVSLKRERNKALSKEQLEIKRMMTKKQNELKEKLFVEVKTKLEEYMDTPDYENLLISQIREILRLAGNHKVTIYIDPADLLKLSGLSAATNTILTLSNSPFMGGTKAVIEERHILIDNSFATKLAEAKSEFSFTGGNVHE